MSRNYHVNAELQFFLLLFSYFWYHEHAYAHTHIKVYTPRKSNIIMVYIVTLNQGPFVGFFVR